jgi:hypothetical protein
LIFSTVIVYAPLDTDEVVHPDRYAAARIVTDDATAIGPVYTVPTVSLGVDPSVVYRMLAPGVDVESVTLCAVAYVPEDGEKVGASTDVPGVPPPPPPHPTNSIVVITQASLLKKTSLLSWVHGLLDGKRRSRAAHASLPTGRFCDCLERLQIKRSNKSMLPTETCQQ